MKTLIITLSTILLMSCAPQVWTDSALFHKTASEHPEWSDEKVEDYVFMSEITFNKKYNGRK